MRAQGPSLQSERELGWEGPAGVPIAAGEAAAERPTVNLQTLPIVSSTHAGISEGELMTFLKKLLGRTNEPKARVRVCIECGMPVDQHKDWCAILKTRLEMERKRDLALRPGTDPAS
jgi:hypothetical protein